MTVLSPHALPALLKVLADPTRLRILALLELEELSVGELSRALGLAQSRVSNHLRVLREGELLRERHVGASTYLRSALPAGGQGKTGYAARLWSSLREGLAELPEHEADRLRLSDLVAQRGPGTAEFFDALAGEWDKRGALFETGQARQRAAAHLLPKGLVLADLGCGTGYMARALAGLATRLICVDRSQGMLDAARKRLDPAPSGTQIEFREGELDALPIADGELDGALVGMVLHHLEGLDDALGEMRRVLRPGGTAVVLELAPHREEWMHRALGDRHLGLEAGDVVAALRRAGFEDVRLETVDDRYCPTAPETEDDRHHPTAPETENDPGSRAVALPLYIVRGRVPAGPDA